MPSFLCKTIAVCFLLTVVSCAAAVDSDQPEQNKNANAGAAAPAKATPPDLTAQLKKKLASINLPPDVLAKATKIVDEFGPQYVACQVKRYAILTPEQQGIHEAKLKANRDAGKKGSDVLDGMLEELHFTPEQRKQWDEIQSKKAAIGVKMNSALRGVLNAEQQARYGLKKESADKESYAN